MAAATILAFARAMGEFGATIMLAGNIPGRTQTMPVAIYTAVQSGDRSLAYYWVAIIMGISFFTIFLMNYWMGYQERRRWKKIMALYVDIEKKCGDFLLKVKFTAEKRGIGAVRCFRLRQEHDTQMHRGNRKAG